MSMADQYEAVLSEEAIAVIWACHIVRDRNISASGDAQIRIGQSIERATIEAFRAKYLPELNLQRCYDIQRDELMAVKERCVLLLAQRGELVEALKTIASQEHRFLGRAKHEQCAHGRYNHEDCDQCASDLAKAALTKTTAAPAA